MLPPPRLRWLITRMAQDLAHTLRTRLAEHPRFAAPKRPPNTFAVDHYAGLVAYACEALMDKNKDFVIAEHQSLMTSSRFPLVQCGPDLHRVAQPPGIQALALCGGQPRATQALSTPQRSLSHSVSACERIEQGR